MQTMSGFLMYCVLTQIGGSIARSSATCSIYKVIVDIDEPSLNLHSSFIQAIRDIDLAKTDNEKELAMETFIEKFGTHYAQSSMMGVGVNFETRYTEQETMEHDDQTLKECNTESGSSSVLGFTSGGSESKCTGSLNNTNTGNTYLMMMICSIFQ